MQASSSVSAGSRSWQEHKGAEKEAALELHAVGLHAKPVLSITRGQEEDRAADVYGLFWFSWRMEDGGAACEVEKPQCLGQPE